MAPFGRVLVGDDGSERARDAVDLALRLLDADGTVVLATIDPERSLRHVWPHSRCGAPLGAAAVPAGVLVEVRRASAASAARGLTELAETERADVVVLGSSRGAGAGRISAGHIGRRLLHGAPCAVALAPVGAGDGARFRHVGVAYDGSDEARLALTAAYQLAEREHAAMTLFTVMPSAAVGVAGLSEADFERAAQAQRRQAQEQLDDAADAAPPTVNPRTVLLRGDPAIEITKAADSIVDVLLAGSRSYGPLQRALVGSVSEGLLARATQPLIVTPRGRAPAQHPN